MSKKYVKRGAGGSISPHDLMRERLLTGAAPQRPAMPPGMPPLPGAPTPGFPANPPMQPPQDFPKFLPEPIGPRGLVAPEMPTPAPRGGGMGGALRGAGAVGAAAIPWMLLNLLEKDSKALSPDADRSYPAMDDSMGEGTPVEEVYSASPTVKKALGKFKKRAEPSDGGTSPVVPVPAPSESDSRVDDRMKERRAAEKEAGAPAGDEPPQRSYQRRFEERYKFGR